MGAAYDQRTTHVLPGSMAGSTVRKSTEDLRSMINGQGGINLNNQVLAQAKNSFTDQQISGNKVAERRNQDLDHSRRRMVSQSPQVCYEYSNASYRAWQLQNNQDSRYQQKRGGQKSINRIGGEIEDTVQKVCSKNNHSLSCRSEKSSLPEIGNRSMNDHHSTVEVNCEACEEEAGTMANSRQFYPTQLVEQLSTSNKDMINQLDKLEYLKESARKAATNKFTQEKNQDSSCLNDTDISVDNHISLSSSILDDAPGSKEKSISRQINLPRIAKQQMNNMSQNTSKTVVHSKQSIKGDGSLPKYQKITSPSKMNTSPFGQRTNSMVRDSSLLQNEVIVPAFNRKQPCASSGGIRREATLSTNIALHPLKIQEVPPSKETITLADRSSAIEKMIRSTSKEKVSAMTCAFEKPLKKVTGSQALTGNLKPLNHTPILRKAQAKNVTGHQTQQEMVSTEITLQKQNQIISKTSYDFQKLNQPRHSTKLQQKSIIDEKTPEQPKRKLNSQTIDEQTSLLSPSITYEDEEKSKEAMTATKETTGTRHGNPSKSPLRGTSIDRSGQDYRAARREMRDATIIAQSLNAEPFYRRAIKRLGWREISQNEIQKLNFHIRFNVGDLEGSTKDLQARQFYNHFPQNRELVTKMGLCKNLWFQCFSEQEHRISHFFPRCYDLSVPQQAETFIQDFNQTAILSIIKIMADSFLKNRGADMSVLFEKYAEISQFREPERFFKPFFKKICIKQDMQRGNLLGIGEVFDAYAFCKDLCNSLQYKEPKKQRKFSGASQLRFSESHLQGIVAFQNELIEKGVPNAGFGTYEQFKIIRLHKKLEELMPQYRQIDGTHNVWIVKPSYNARGVGIYCTRQLREILRDTEKTQQKVVQKYIERPFCVEGRRKFDFRQWVLVNSWEPLDVCVFQSAYLKLCGNKFDLKQVSDVYRHLSNYSIQKDNGEREELVMSSIQFETFMRDTSPQNKNFSWANDMLPKINDVVWRTLKGVQENIEQKSNTFEVYGFDIVLDEDLNPWVIEVNLSPACSERASWLTQMLDDSCTDLLRHIQSRILTAFPADTWVPEMAALREQASSAPHKTTKYLNPKTFYEEYEIQERWIRLPESIKEIKEFCQQQAMAPQKGIQFELCGEKADLRFERKMDRDHRRETCATEIQRLYRGYRGRQVFLQMLRNKKAIIIQRRVRVVLAKLELLRRRKNFAANVLQNQLRRMLAQKVALQLKNEKILAQKIHIVTKLQTRFRMAKAKIEVHQIRQDRAVRRCQNHMRGYLTRNKVRKERTRLCLIVRIQRFYKKHFRVKQRSSAVVQKFLKRLLVVKRVARMKKIVHHSSRLEHLVKMKEKNLGLQKLRLHNKSITIQSIVRMILCQRRYKLLIRAQVQKALRGLLRRKIIRELFQSARYLRKTRDTSAMLLQKYLKGNLARKRVKQQQFEQLQLTSINVIKRYMKGYLGKKEAKRRRIKIGASIMIQSLVRGFLTRRRIIKQKLRAAYRSDTNSQLQKKMSSRLLENHSSNKFLKSRTQQSNKHQTNTTTRARGSEKDDKSVRYQSNPPSNNLKKKQSQLGLNGRNLAANGSQGSLVQSSTSLRRSEIDFAQQMQAAGKLISQQSNGKKKKNKKQGKAQTSNEYHFELGLRHLVKQQSVLQEKLVKAQRATQQEILQLQKEKKTTMQTRPGQSADVQQNQQQRLGKKIVQNLQHQTMKSIVDQTLSVWNQSHNATLTNLGLASQMRSSNLPGVRQQNGEERFDRLRISTLKETQQSIGLPLVESASSEQEVVLTGGRQQKQIMIEPTANIDKALLKQQQTPHQQVAMTPQMKGVKNSFGGSKTSFNKNQDQSSHKKLPSKRLDTFNLPAMPSMRSSLETKTIAQLTEGEKTVARGLGKDKDVSAMKTSLDTNRSGRGQATTIVMRKNPSKSSLNSKSGRDPALLLKGSAQQQQYRHHLALCGDTEKGDQFQLPQAHNQNHQSIQNFEMPNKRGGKVKSKQLKNLEKLVQHGCPYIEKQSRPAHNRIQPTAALKDKAIDQQYHLPNSGLQPLKNTTPRQGQGQRQKSEKQKSFASYLGEMLQSQARQADSKPSNRDNNVIGMTMTQNYDSQTKSNEAFSSLGKASMSGIRMHQPDFKPIRSMQNSQGGAVPNSLQASNFPEVNLPNTKTDDSRTEKQQDMRSSRVETITSFASRDDADQSFNVCEKQLAARNVSSPKVCESNLTKRISQRKSYNKAQAAFNKTKNGYLEQIRKDQERRFQAVSDAHKISQSAIQSLPAGAIRPSLRPESRSCKQEPLTSIAHPERQDDSRYAVSNSRKSSRGFNSKRSSTIYSNNMVII